MKRDKGKVLLLVCFLVLSVAQAEESTERDRKRLNAMKASGLDPALPDVSFEEWLSGVLPKGVEVAYERNDCGEQTGEPSIDSRREMPACLGVYAHIISRARSMDLMFHVRDLRFRGGTVFSEELEGTISLKTLSGLEPALKKPLRAFPLQCPQGTALKVEEQHAGVREWCEDSQGRKQGPYRAWFSTGIYLMHRGSYRDDARTGEWIECSRFESCLSKTY